MTSTKTTPTTFHTDTNDREVGGGGGGITIGSAASSSCFSYSASMLGAPLRAGRYRITKQKQRSDNNGNTNTGNYNHQKDDLLLSLWRKEPQKQKQQQHDVKEIGTQSQSQQQQQQRRDEKQSIHQQDDPSAPHQKNLDSLSSTYTCSYGNNNDVTMNRTKVTILINTLPFIMIGVQKSGTASYSLCISLLYCPLTMNCSVFVCVVVLLPWLF